MLEPTNEDPKVLLEHHRRQAALHLEAGDHRAAYWHGRKAQVALSQIHRLEEAIEDAHLDRLWDRAFSEADGFTMAAIEATRAATQKARVAAKQASLDMAVIMQAKEPVDAEVTDLG